MKHRSAAVASKIIELSLNGCKFSVSDIEADITNSPSRQTIYRICDQLQEDDWIEQRGNGWHPSVKAQMIGSVDGGGRDRGDRDGGGFEIDLDEVL